jgi:hypothetical protein
MQNQVPRHGGTDSIDDPGDAFSKYLVKEDKRIKKVEDQRADAHEVLIFVCFSI